MKILLLANYRNDGQESMQRFAALLALGLQDPAHELRVCRPGAFFGHLCPPGRLGKWLGYLDKFLLFPWRLRKEIQWADLVHICDHANSVYLKHLQSVPHIVTCHDLLAIRSALGEIPQNRTAWTGRRLQRWIVNGLRQAQHVTCVSNATQRELLRLTGISGERVSRTYNSLNYAFSPMDRGEARNRVRKLGVDPGEPFLLHVGGNQWYKNRPGVLRIYSRLQERPETSHFRLVMAGKPWTAEMRHFVSAHRLGDRVRECAAVGGEDLRALYSLATLMVFPSLQEGFGWPIIEAQACGCPVATSGRPPLDEIGGDAAVYFDPENADSVCVAIEHALATRPELREAGFRNARRFAAPAMMHEYLSLYDKAIKDGPIRRAPRLPGEPRRTSAVAGQNISPRRATP